MRAWMAVVAIAAPAAGQVELSARLEEGRVDRYRIEATIEQSQEGEGALGSRTLTQSVDLRLTTVGVDSDGRATVSVVVEAAQAELVERDVAGEATTRGFEWPPEGEEAEDESALREAWSALVGSVLRCTVARDGRILSIEGSTEAWREGGEAMSLLGVLAPGAAERTLGWIWRIDPAGEARSPGDQWRVVEEVALSPGRRVRHVRELTLDRVGDGVAVVAGRVTSELAPAPGGTMVEMALSGGGSVEAAWDLERGAAQSRTERGEMVIDSSLGEHGPRVRTTVRNRLSLTRLGP